MMKRFECFDLLEVINQILPKSKIVKLNMYLYSNKDILESENEKLRNSITVSEKFKEYENKRLVLCREYAEKDDNNEPKIKDGVFVGLNTNDDFIGIFDALVVEYKTHIEEYKDQMGQYNALMDEDIDIELDKFDVDIIPDGLVDGVQFKYIRMLFKD